MKNSQFTLVSENKMYIYKNFKNMGRIRKDANLYDSAGNLITKAGEYSKDYYQVGRIYSPKYPGIKILNKNHI